MSVNTGINGTQAVLDGWAEAITDRPRSVNNPDSRDRIAHKFPGPDKFRTSLGGQLEAGNGANTGGGRGNW